MGNDVIGGDIATDSLRTTSYGWDHSVFLSYEPKKDITAYELALLIGFFNEHFKNSLNLGTLSMRHSHWNNVPDEVKRHFRIL